MAAAPAPVPIITMSEVPNASAARVLAGGREEETVAGGLGCGSGGGRGATAGGRAPEALLKRESEIHFSVFELPNNCQT